jgi:hypothetical protein
MSLVLAVLTLEDLREHVHQILCSRDQTDPRQTQLTEAALTRSGRPCGVLFQTRGPRSLLTRAIWAADENRILFYDSRGTRFHEARLIEPVTLPAARWLETAIAR